MTTTKHCSCCLCIRNEEYQNLNSVEEQIEFLNKLTTVDKLRVIVHDSTYTHVDELLTDVKVIDMKKLLLYVKSCFEMKDCDELHFFTDISDKHIDEICQLIAKYIIFQIDILDDYFDLHIENAVNQNDLNLAILAYMFKDECEFILTFILQTKEQKERYVNVLIDRHFIYQDCFHPYVTNETIKKFIEFHN